MRKHRPSSVSYNNQITRPDFSRNFLQTLQIRLLLDFIIVRWWLVVRCGVVWCGVVWCVCEVPQITGAGCDEEEEGG